MEVILRLRRPFHIGQMERVGGPDPLAAPSDPVRFRDRRRMAATHVPTPILFEDLKRLPPGRHSIAVEEVARATGCERLEVTTRPHRDDAFGFYLDAGFEERPRRLVRPVA